MELKTVKRVACDYCGARATVPDHDVLDGWLFYGTVHICKRCVDRLKARKVDLDTLGMLMMDKSITFETVKSFAFQCLELFLRPTPRPRKPKETTP